MAGIFIRVIALIEMMIGLVTISGLFIYTFVFFPTKPFNVFMFVLISAALSSAIGLGLFIYREWARMLLVFFSGYIIITKVMVLSRLAELSGEMLVFIPNEMRDTLSILYHGLIILFFTRRSVKAYFKSR